MAKAKPKKPNKRIEFAVLPEQLVREINVLVGRVASLEEAICPRVAARLTHLEKQNQMAIAREEHVINSLKILDREHDALGKVVNDNAEKSDKLQAHVSALIARRPSPVHNAAFSAPYGTKEAYQRLWTDLFKEEPVPRTSHLDANEAWLMNNIVGIASSRMSRLARAELILRLRAMNGPVGP